MSETTLWTNSSPTSAMGSTQITSINIDSYDYIKITFRFSASNSTLTSYIAKVSEFKQYTSPSDPAGAYGVGTFTSGEGARSRRYYYISGGGVGFTAATIISSQNNNAFIPYSIVGMRMYVS